MNVGKIVGLRKQKGIKKVCSCFCTSDFQFSQCVVLKLFSYNCCAIYCYSISCCGCLSCCGCCFFYCCD